MTRPTLPDLLTLLADLPEHVAFAAGCFLELATDVVRLGHRLDDQAEDHAALALRVERLERR